MNLEDMLSEINQTQEHKYCIIPLRVVEYIKTVKWWLPVVGGGEIGKLYNSTEFPFGKMREF